MKRCISFLQLAGSTLLILCIFVPIAGGDEARFVFEDLVGFGGSSGSANKILMTQGELSVAGQSFEQGDQTVTAFVWNSTDGLVRLPYLSESYPSCAAADLNSKGTVAGFCISDTFPLVHAIRWDNGTLIDLTPDCPLDCEAHAINSHGHIVGFYRHAESGLDEAARWDSAGMTLLGTLGEHSHAYDISNKGRIAGESQIAGSGEPHAVIYTQRGLMDLGGLGGYGSAAIATNEKGFVVGTAGLASGPSAGFFYNPKTRTMKPIPAMPESDWAIALDINESQQVVGQFSAFRDEEYFYHAFFWEPGLNSLIDLNDVVRLPEGWFLYDARGLTDPSGHQQLPYIVGTVNLPDGTSRPYLLRPR